MGQKVEGYWDCPYCGRKANLGRYRNCPGCGKPRGSSTKFYVGDAKRLVSDDVVPKGPDWYCECCDSYNTYSAEYCASCGAPKGATKNYFEMQRKNELNYFEVTSCNDRDDSSPLWNDRNSFGEKDSYDNGHYEDYLYKSREEPKKEEEPVKEPSYSSTSSTTKESFIKSINFDPKVIFITLLIIAVISGCIYAFMPKEITLNITEVSWVRSIDIEEYKTVREDDWSVPAGGRVVYTQQEIHHYDTVLDHYETVTEQKSETYISGYTTVTEYVDLGNGYFDTNTHQEPEYSTRYYTETRQEPVYRDEPVYRTKYYYDIERWVYARTERTSGSTSEPVLLETPDSGESDGRTLYWPEPAYKSNERERSRSQSFNITGIEVSNKKMPTRAFVVPYDTWVQINPGDTIKAIVSFGTMESFSFVE